MRFETMLEKRLYTEAVEGLKHFTNEHIIKMDKLLDEKLKKNTELRNLFAKHPIQ